MELILDCATNSRHLHEVLLAAYRKLHKQQQIASIPEEDNTKMMQKKNVWRG